MSSRLRLVALAAEVAKAYPGAGSPTPRSPGGRITKQGSKLVPWAAIEAVARHHGGDHLMGSFRPSPRRGTEEPRWAIARKVLTLVYHGLRDGEIRCLRDRQGA